MAIRAFNTRRWVVAGALAGVAAGVVFAVFEMVVDEIRGAGFWMPMRMIGAIVLGEEATKESYSLATAAVVGGALHMALSALYGAVFGLIAALARLARATIVLGATVYGIALWLVNFYAIAPAAFPWFENADPTVQFVAHAFFFGTVAGALLAARRVRYEPLEAAALDAPLHRERRERGRVRVHT